MLEVEVKAKINQEKVPEKLLTAGAIPAGEEKQVDTYFNHPCFDFRSKDEALRIRQVDDKIYLTFKGPRIDSETKTRSEIQVEVKGEIFVLLKALGFFPLQQVVKKREFYHWQGLKVSFDKVEGLGNFLEIEGQSREDKDKIFHLLDKLDIKAESLIKKSYLELIMEKDKL